ncbi:MAG: 1-(5-phosphoribosyl)-5-[(5-phosphoribosylamino)methylideneamino]imidazole-4-carboxamide isomerase [Phycisphaerae bacterium]|nr:1-(5-phosphoribosyl)-5-[(5-phosphoribosylamino)methylideneamino]imidazole-4-carboxamide isomerase [Phycisphaerae bacterium]
MYIIPAIDLMDANCVRLIQGQYHRQIKYSQNPVKQALSFEKDGAQWLHVVDLDGAKLGRPVNTTVVAEIVEKTNLKVEVGGGIRDEKAIVSLLDMGAERVIIGTRAVEEFDWFTEMAEKFPQKLVLGLDAKGAKVATHGWTQQKSQNLIDFAKKTQSLPIAAIIYTDITKDGMMTGPNFERTKELADTVNVPIVASGGINTIEDVEKLKQFGNIDAAIIGRAFYEKTMLLKEAIKTAE